MTNPCGSCGRSWRTRWTRHLPQTKMPLILHLQCGRCMWPVRSLIGVIHTRSVTLETQVDQLCRYGAVFPEPGWDTSRSPAPSGICTELRILRELMRSSTRTVAGWLWLLPPCWQCVIQKSLHQEEWRGVQIDVLLFFVAGVQFSSNIFRQVHPKNPGEILYIHYLIYIYIYVTYITYVTYVTFFSTCNKYVHWPVHRNSPFHRPVQGFDMEILEILDVTASPAESRELIWTCDM